MGGGSRVSKPPVVLTSSRYQRSDGHLLDSLEFKPSCPFLVWVRWVTLITSVANDPVCVA